MEKGDELVISKIDGVYTYNRKYHPLYDKLLQTMALKYNIAKCWIGTSGMNAISSLFHSLLFLHRNEPIHCILATELFPSVPKVVKSLLSFYDQPVPRILSFVDVNDTEKILETITKHKQYLTILYVESCSNPNGYVIDYDTVIPQARKICQQLIFVVDNTWLTSEIFNPFEHGADYVVNSLTKYYSGGTAICGCILGHDTPVMKRVFIWSNLNGIHVSPHTCQIVLDNIQTLKERIEKSSNLTRESLNLLKSLYPEIRSFILLCSLTIRLKTLVVISRMIFIQVFFVWLFPKVIVKTKFLPD